MITPEDKGRDLMKKIRPFATIFISGKPVGRSESSKALAIICCDEMIDYVGGWDKENEMEFNEGGGHVEFWEAVKQYITDNY